MTLSATSWQTRALWDVSGALPGGPVQEPVRSQVITALSSQIATLWEESALDAAITRGGWAVKLQYLHTRLGAIDWVLGWAWSRVDNRLGPLTMPFSQQFRQLFQLREATLKEIDLLEKRVRLTRGPVGAGLLQRAPQMAGRIDPPAPVGPGQPSVVPVDPSLQPAAVLVDANDPRLQGDPRYPGHGYVGIVVR
jgi:hypothetical protein